METAVQIEKDIEELTSLEKLEQLFKLADFDHVERRENINCSNCLFVINLRYLYLQNTVLENDCMAPLQKYCRLKYGNFYCLTSFALFRSSR